MEGFKEFQGKNLDDAINAACSYYDAPRERLEIDIIQDSKSGIFGIVGARKAKIKARRVQLRATVENLLGRSASPAVEIPATETPSEDPAAPIREEQPRERAQKNQDADRKPPRPPKPARARQPREAAPAEAPVSAPRPEVPAEEETALSKSRRRGGRGRAQAPRREDGGEALPALDADASADEAFSEGLTEVPFEELDQDRLCALGLEAVSRLVHPIVGKVPLTVTLDDGRVNVAMDCGDDSGLLIGREGQTLASLQYLASRIVSRGMNAAVRVQLDAGEYRMRQDEKLRELALSLAEKVRGTGKSHSTRPLSSYHRRIIHMTLQDDPDVQTRSSGEGPLKRVVIQRKKG